MAEQLAEQDEADLAQRAVEMNARIAPPPPPSNPAFWFEDSKPPARPDRVAEGTGRFADLDRMAETERNDEALIEQRVTAYRESLPPVEPNDTVEHGGLKIAVYLDGKAREVNRREAEVEKIQEGGRRK
ncbi:MAG: hypothetical protein ACRC20_06240 [Segniliparus sp.]|uniref:hypothetical protein n=1 Tax=Segniliparus sp. TaxID=2804064 RepID=UPI003F3C087C